MIAGHAAGVAAALAAKLQVDAQRVPIVELQQKLRGQVIFYDAGPGVLG